MRFLPAAPATAEGMTAVLAQVHEAAFAIDTDDLGGISPADARSMARHLGSA
ncbi:hypothetical protein [Nannocystis bainbridge]|uniref:Uncharacterized protein n=1 Tax=Nannocystis bainbridge TaxID=2995303 RepID=A0ABT5DY32_9BACT|nr:hypothetical protein [Nannocystis bainbridge]MDC0718078.1 hypothetical protein [Nannocystis bainbridge]